VKIPDPVKEPTVSIVKAGELLGIGRTVAYQAAQEDRFPVPILRVGSQWRVPTAPLLQALGLEPPKSSHLRVVG
jgi:hypothetical protein